MTTPFEPRSAGDAARLIADYPLAWLVSRAFHSSPLPLIAETDDSGAIVSLFGHCGRRNPLVADFRADPYGLILFNGPQGYVSPGLLSKPDWAPTWNYAVLRFTVDVEFVEDETRDAVERLVFAMEGDRWSTDRVGPRYEAMLDQIIAFRAHVVSAEHSFKLGQDESATGLAEIVAGHRDRTLAAWMEEQAKP
ncbi:FMN-binding negative transcriptional regulator [Sphingopyxis sp. BSN-002]|uniref:FMN-binding negative transcriptional regulator n=1 Tax=Sphingopyxis sp. BSN-002 TaxID=2911495 RepID=UPI001EDAB3BF|nr:FMN-binding negative transcriptional regulator [Sphingopyxis sp. BSN-002]UKK85167.1 FMN-binding negative transcriptional regulator [Sphingopyxis sp. BSN-002]